MLALDRMTSQPASRQPLTPLQAGMLYHRLRGRERDSDVQQVVLFAGPGLDGERLRAAWQAVSDRHDALRTSFRWDGDEPVAEVWSAPVIPFAIDDHSRLEAGERDAVIERCLDEERTRIDLSSAPLTRVRLLRFDDAVAIVWTNHHAILDGRARSIVLREIAERYAGRELPPAAAQFSRHVDWLGQRESSSDEPFWRAYLHGLRAATPLPATARPENAGDTPPPPACTVRTLDAADTAALAAFARTHGLTVSTLVHAAWALLLSRCASVPDVVFGAVRACRRSGAEGSADIVGPLINTLPLRIQVDEDASVAAWLQHVRSQWQALRDVEHSALTAIAAWTSFARPGPLFESLVVVEHETLAGRTRTLDPSGTLGIRDARVRDRTTYPLTLAAAGSSHLELRLQADPARYDGADAERLLDAVTAALTSLPGAAGARVRDISMTSAAERQRVLGFNRTSSYPRDATIAALFAEVAAQRPDAVAAQLGSATITYAELARRATGVAAYLQALGIGRGDYVGLCVERSFDMLAALIGIVQAGAASVAVELHQPAERLTSMLGEAGVRVLLAQRHLLDALAPALAQLPAALHAVPLDQISGHAGDTFVPDPHGHALDPAHVMYTSGSTGAPKGAVLPQRAVVRTVRGAGYLNFDPGETFFGFVPLTFDVAILEIWGPLLNGARVVLCPPGLPSLDVLAATIEARGVTTLWLTTALFEHMVDEQLPRLRGLRALIVGGDVMSPSHARRAMAALPNTRLLNVCGPTEASVLIVAQQLRTPPAGPIPIGSPIANARVYLLGPDRQPVPVGVPGEIYTGGDGVALGYLNRPDLTAERFVPDPFDNEPGATMYRTGDLGRWNADGSIAFLGRVDNQVKINGIRIEPGEIEAALTEHPGLREAVVIATASPTGEKQLIAYAVPRGACPTVADVRAFVGARLPNSMVPAHVVFLASLPLTPTGKFDRKALPAVPVPEHSAENEARRLPETAAEITVAAHVATILNRDDVGLDENFFAAGGDSLRAMRLVSRLRDVFGVELSIRDLLAAPTVAGIASAVSGLTHGAVRPPLPLVTAYRTTGYKPPLVFLHGDVAGGGYYCNELARRIGAERPFYVVAPNGTEAGSGLPVSIESAARENIAALAAQGVRGPLVLGGFCNGGMVAYEMACRLARAGVAVERVVLIDVFPRNVGLSLRQRMRRRVRRVLDRLGYARLRLPRSPGKHSSWERWQEYVLERWHFALTDYVPGSYGGDVSLLWSDESAPHAAAFTPEWRRVAPQVRAARIPGTHLTSITRYVRQTCDVIAAHVERRAPTDWDERAIALDRLQRTPAAGTVLP